MTEGQKPMINIARNYCNNLPRPSSSWGWGHSQRAPKVSSKSDWVLCHADRVKYPGRPDEAPQCQLGPFWSDRCVTALTKTQCGTQEERQEGTAYSQNF